MDKDNTIPSFVAPGGNRALAVRAPSRTADNESDCPSSPSAQQDSHPTLDSLVADSTPVANVKGTVDGVKELDDTDGPDDAFIIPPPPAFARRPAVSAEHSTRAFQQVSTNYGGNRLSYSNLSANIPDEENCSLFIHNLPPLLTYAQLYAAFTGAGRFASAHIIHPNEDHATSAATRGNLVIDGHKAKALWNRVKVATRPHPGGSRVIWVTGHPFVVNTEHLLSYFSAHFHFNLDGVRLIHRGYATATVEVKFASFINQADNAYRLLNGEKGFQDRVTVSYARDPCEFSEQ
ncbi:hypothetical protein PG989_003792 [Apiospora arundinis]